MLPLGFTAEQILLPPSLSALRKGREGPGNKEEGRAVRNSPGSSQVRGWGREGGAGADAGFTSVL